VFPIEEEEANDPILLKKLLQQDGAWDTHKELLGFVALTTPCGCRKINERHSSPPSRHGSGLYEKQAVWNTSC
jgi:hypothetical protein